MLCWVSAEGGHPRTLKGRGVLIHALFRCEVWLAVFCLEHSALQRHDGDGAALAEVRWLSTVSCQDVSDGVRVGWAPCMVTYALFGTRFTQLRCRCDCMVPPFCTSSKWAGVRVVLSRRGWWSSVPARSLMAMTSHDLYMGWAWRPGPCRVTSIMRFPMISIDRSKTLHGFADTHC